MTRNYYDEEKQSLYILYLVKLIPYNALYINNDGFIRILYIYTFSHCISLIFSSFILYIFILYTKMYIILQVQ